MPLAPLPDKVLLRMVIPLVSLVSMPDWVLAAIVVPSAANPMMLFSISTLLAASTANMPMRLPFAITFPSALLLPPITTPAEFWT